MGQLLQIAAAPNPVTQGRLGIDFKLDGQARHAEARLYTKALVVAWQGSLDGDFGPGWNRQVVDLGGLPQGFYVLTLRVGASRKLAPVFLMK
jgi:hypothetical protein